MANISPKDITNPASMPIKDLPTTNASTLEESVLEDVDKENHSNNPTGSKPKTIFNSIKEYFNKDYRTIEDKILKSIKKKTKLNPSDFSYTNLSNSYMTEEMCKEIQSSFKKHKLKDNKLAYLAAYAILEDNPQNRAKKVKNYGTIFEVIRENRDSLPPKIYKRLMGFMFSTSGTLLGFVNNEDIRPGSYHNSIRKAIRGVSTSIAIEHYAK